MPFHRQQRRSHAVLGNLRTSAEWTQPSAGIAAGREKPLRLEPTTIAYAHPGEFHARRDANMQGEDTSPDRVMGRPGRRGRNWFSFDVPVDPAHPMALVVTHNHDEWQERTFDVLVDGERLATQTLERRGPLRFFDVEHPIPAGVVEGKTKVTVRFQATQGNEVGCVFGLRMIRADAER